jgi:uncharacterized membrane protein
MEENPVCKICRQPVQISWNFCPNCGTTLRGRPLSISVWKQVLVYSISFFLPPLGLGYAFSYLKAKDNKSKVVGTVAIILTVISILLLVFSFKAFIEYYSKILNGIGNGNYSTIY